MPFNFSIKLPPLFSASPYSLNIDGAKKHLLWDMLAFSLVIIIFLFLAWGADQLVKPLAFAEMEKISLDPSKLFVYGLKTTLRMLLAVGFSLIFSILYAVIAVKSRRAGQIMIPLLDVLQSIPVLGYISFTVTGFIALFPHRNLGLELAVIFAIFTSQVWNMAFSLYQSLSNIPRDIDEAASVFHLSSWQKFWRMEMPFAMPGLIWNMMMSMSGGWFFVVASEAITVGNTKVILPGIGSYIACAIEEQNLPAIGYAIMAMMVIILLYDQLLFRPLVAWSDKFRYEMTAGETTPDSWVLRAFQKSALASKIFFPVEWCLSKALRIKFSRSSAVFADRFKARTKAAKYLDYIWYGVLCFFAVSAIFYIGRFLLNAVSLGEIIKVTAMAFATLARVLVLVLLASVIWVPIGIYIGLRPKLAEKVQALAQFLAAFPANIVFPLAVMAIVRFGLNSNIWLSPLMIFGAQWYILFNVIAGASVFPNDLRDVAKSFKVSKLQWWQKIILPGIFPYYLTGAIAASGGAWNASIVAEAVNWGNENLEAFGLGNYIAKMTAAGDYAKVALGIGVMALFVVIFNRLFWRKLYEVAAKKLRLD